MAIKAVIRKEMMDGIRNYRFIIVAAGFLFFAILDPVMNKYLLPMILQSQFPGMQEDFLMTMIESTQRGVIRMYLNDSFQIGTIVMVFVLSSITASEIGERTIILPSNAGIRYHEMLLGKIFVHGLAVFLISVISSIINYIYSGALFGFEISIVPLLMAGIYQGSYMLYVIGILILTGLLVKKAVTAGLITLLAGFGTIFVGGLFKIDRFLPSQLIKEASLLSATVGTSGLQSLIITFGLIVLIIFGSLMILRKIEPAGS